MNSNPNQLESCHDLIIQDALFDIAASIAATEPGADVEPKNPPAAQPAPALRWAMRESMRKAS